MHIQRAVGSSMQICQKHLAARSDMQLVRGAQHRKQKRHDQSIVVVDFQALPEENCCLVHVILGPLPCYVSF